MEKILTKAELDSIKGGKFRIHKEIFKGVFDMPIDRARTGFYRREKISIWFPHLSNESVRKEYAVTNILSKDGIYFLEAKAKINPPSKIIDSFSKDRNLTDIDENPRYVFAEISGPYEFIGIFKACGSYKMNEEDAVTVYKKIAEIS